MATDDADADRLAALESQLEELRETVEQQQYTIRYLTADADIEGLDAVCPHCEQGTFQKRSGISWEKVVCDNCGHEEYL